MKQEYDRQRDVMKMVHSDKAVVKTMEYVDGPVRHVIHLDEDSEIVFIEIHSYSKLEEVQAKTARMEWRADPDAVDELGTVEWVLTDGKTEAVLSSGTTVPRLKDVTVELVESPSRTVCRAQFPLTEHFSLGLSGGYSESVDVSGFALLGLRDDVLTFSWDWFQVVGPDRAQKIQESGELGITVADPGGNWQVVRTDFLTDVSVRIARTGEEQMPCDLPSWRILVKEGSTVTWPSLVEGKVVPN